MKLKITAAEWCPVLTIDEDGEFETEDIDQATIANWKATYKAFSAMQQEIKNSIPITHRIGQKENSMEWYGEVDGVLRHWFGTGPEAHEAALEWLRNTPKPGRSENGPRYSLPIAHRTQRDDG